MISEEYESHKKYFGTDVTELDVVTLTKGVRYLCRDTSGRHLSELTFPGFATKWYE